MPSRLYGTHSTGSRSYYNGTRKKHINMRLHLAGLIEGDEHNIQFGHWIIYRELDKSRRSTNYDETNKESRLGPGFQYRDYLIKARLYEQAVSRGAENTSEDPLSQIRIDPDSVLYYVQYQKVCYSEKQPDGFFGDDASVPTERFLLPKIGDNIFEIDKYEGRCTPQPPFEVEQAFRITDVLKIQGDYGRIEYFLCVCKKLQVNYS